MKVTITFGVQTITRDVTQGDTVGTIVNDDVLAVFGCPDNIRMTVAGVEVPAEAQGYEGMVINLATRCNEKAS